MLTPSQSHSGAERLNCRGQAWTMRPSVSSSGAKTESSRREDEPSHDDPTQFPGPGSPWSVCLQDRSTLSESGLFCRICHCGEGEGERLISPCHCSGSVGLLHRSCLEKWLSSVNKDTCELCHQKYRVSRHSRPFSSWLLSPAVGDDQRNLMGDTVCFLLLTPLTTISAYLCASGASYYFHVSPLLPSRGLSGLQVIFTQTFSLADQEVRGSWTPGSGLNADLHLPDLVTPHRQIPFPGRSPQSSSSM